MCFFNYHGNIITFSTNLKNRNDCITTVQSFWYIFFVFCFFFVLTTCLLVHTDTNALQEGGGGDITIHPKFSGHVQPEFLCAIALPASSALFPGLAVIWCCFETQGCCHLSGNALWLVCPHPFRREGWAHTCHHTSPHHGTDSAGPQPHYLGGQPGF